MTRHGPPSSPLYASSPCRRHYTLHLPGSTFNFLTSRPTLECIAATEIFNILSKSSQHSVMNSQYAILNTFSHYGGFHSPAESIHSSRTLPYRTDKTSSTPRLTPNSNHPRLSKQARKKPSKMASKPSDEEMATMQNMSNNYVPDVQVSMNELLA